ncbi:PREDICTED: protein yellow-like [Papilio polytes]|uniref:protein yellow-like n=1 Tax=Papilio polytes TaxID=76194 RepID=UPI000675CA60|nr:PREDICTED: protein yellow-like [Papilio polytes]
MKYFVCFLILLLDKTRGHIQGRFGLQEVFKWKQMTYDFNGHIYESSSDSELQTQKQNNVADAEKFFTQYNNVPIGMEVFGNRVFVTVPRRRHGIPSTLNYVKISSGTSPALIPYPDTKSRNKFVSVYRPRVDVCGRLWMVDTGHLEVPGERKQIQPPAIVVYDLKTDEEIVRYELKSTDLVNERSSAGLTSITVDVDKKSCDDAYAYINDLATEGMIVFSLKNMDSWRVNHRSFVHDENAMNFTAAGYVINWKDGLFSVTLTDPDTKGKRKAFYHPLVSTQEFAIDTEFLKNNNFPERNTYFGERGNNTQSGSHDYHAPSRIIFYANVAQDAILCWNIDTEMTPENVAIVAQDHKKLAYISDLKIVGDEVYVLVNQIPKFIYSRFDINEYNFFIHRYRVFDLILGTVCDIAAP